MKHHISKVLIAFILVFSILIPITPRMVTAVATDGAIPVTNETAATPSEEISIPTDMLPSDKKVTTAELTKDSQILKYIDETVFAAKEHVARLPELETLSSYAFLNSDGTTTVYYMDKEVKYIDSNGKIAEKDISLTSTSKGYTTLSNDVVLELPYNPASGIVLSYDGYDISLIPQGGSLQKVAKSSENAVIYPDYFGTDMSLVYTPTLSGLKEEIVLSRYTGINAFSFRLNTDGLNLYSDNGRYYLAASETAEMRMDMGDVVTFDATGRFSIGTMEVETIKSGAEYVLTLTVDKDFLAAESTTYPVSIDPSLTVSDNTHGAGAIEDVSIYSGRPNANGDWTYLHSGYYDDTYQVARTLFRLSGLLSSNEYKTTSAADITSAEFHIKEATGTAALPVSIYANVGSSAWTETGATWNNAGHVLGAQYATASPGINETTIYDITSLVKAWKNDSESAAAGFILKSSNETSVDKAFYSSEITSTSYRPYVVITYTSLSEALANATRLTLSSTPSVTISSARQVKCFSFTPPTTDFYTFASSTSSTYPTISLYNSDCALLKEQKSTTTQHFRLTYHLIAGETYYIAVGCHSQNTGTYTFSIASTTSGSPPSAGAITLQSDKSINICASYENSYYSFFAPATGDFVFISSNCTGDPKIWIYDSNFNLINSDDDSGQDNNFRLNVSLTLEQTYYISLGHHSSLIGSYTVTALMPIIIPDGVNHLKNRGTEMYLDIHGPVEQEYAHQWSLHKDDQCRWLFQLQPDGYYTIRSQYGSMYYLGINSSNTGEDNIVLSQTISDNARWNIYGNNYGALILEPKNAPGKVLCVPNAERGTELQLCWISESPGTSLNKIWCIEIEWDVQEEGQQWENWCWLASTRMLVSNYLSVDTSYTQIEAFRVVKNKSPEPKGGDLTETLKAANYYYSGSTNNNHFQLITAIPSEYELRQYLDNGNAVLILTGHYVNNLRQGGHASLIVGYTTLINAGSLQYRFLICDPTPIPEPDWGNQPLSEPPLCSRTNSSYQDICNDSENGGILEGFIVKS